MSYLVLARKYRPQRFEEIVGQEHVTRTLANAFAKGRVHHAFLFCGPRGVGKTTAARVLAKALCCEAGPTPTPCGACEPCRTITAGTAVDYFEIDGASNNSVDNVRELREGVKYQPAQLRRKIYVIDEVHMLTTAAFNALLKTLEEPPPHVTFIFATTEVHKIPITILSRCQRYDFKLVPQARLVAHLERILTTEAIVADKGAVGLIAREAGGSVRDMLSLADQVIAYAGGDALTEAKVAEVLGVADRGLLRELARAVLERDGGAALAAIDAATARGVDLGHLSRAFLGTLRDLLVVKDVAAAEGLVEATPDELAWLREKAQGVSRAQLSALFERFARACEELARSPVPRLVVDVALLDMAASEPLVAVAELVARLEAMEGRLRSGSASGAGGIASGGGARTSAGGTRGAARPGSTSGAAFPTVPAASTSAAPAGTPAGMGTAAANVPAASSGARVPADPMGEWERAITALEKRSVTLAGIYSHARLLDWTERGIVLGFASDSLHASLGADPDHVANLKKFLAAYAGAPLDVQVKAIHGIPVMGAGPSRVEAPTSLAEVEDGRRREERARREEQARQHPMTKAVLETFGAQIKEIKIDG